MEHALINWMLGNDFGFRSLVHRGSFENSRKTDVWWIPLGGFANISVAAKYLVPTKLSVATRNTSEKKTGRKRKPKLQWALTAKQWRFMLYSVHDICCLIKFFCLSHIACEVFLSFDHVAFVSQWSLYTRNEKYTEIVLSIKFAVSQMDWNTLWTKPQ